MRTLEKGNVNSAIYIKIYKHYDFRFFDFRKTIKLFCITISCYAWTYVSRKIVWRPQKRPIFLHRGIWHVKKIATCYKLVILRRRIYSSMLFSQNWRISSNRENWNVNKWTNDNNKYTYGDKIIVDNIFRSISI